jgi:hypothetical protein
MKANIFEVGEQMLSLFLFVCLMYFNSKLTGTAQQTDNIKNTLACRTTRLEKYQDGWDLLYDKNATNTI